jgi:hypothetical protein
VLPGREEAFGAPKINSTNPFSSHACQRDSTMIPIPIYPDVYLFMKAIHVQ